MIKYLIYLLFKTASLFFSIVPFKILYLFSDMVYFLLYYVFSYRKNVVLANIKYAFPEKNLNEIDIIAKEFYKNLADITLESIKGISLNNKSLLKRYKVTNPEILEELFRQNKSVIGIGSHYANWEWGVLSFSLQFPHKCYGLYKPIKNKYINKYFMRSRAQNNMHLHSIKETKALFEIPNEKPALYFMISDQSPSNLNHAIWVNFMNQPTACLHGPGYYAKKYNLPVVYGDVQRIKRGHYNIHLTQITENSQSFTVEEITQMIMKQLEDITRKNPSHWLWSHKRWKHKKL